MRYQSALSKRCINSQIVREARRNNDLHFVNYSWINIASGFKIFGYELKPQ